LIVLLDGISLGKKKKKKKTPRNKIFSRRNIPIYFNMVERPNIFERPKNFRNFFLLIYKSYDYSVLGKVILKKEEKNAVRTDFENFSVEGTWSRAEVLGTHNLLGIFFLKADFFKSVLTELSAMSGLYSRCILGFSIRVSIREKKIGKVFIFYRQPHLVLV